MPDRLKAQPPGRTARTTLLLCFLGALAEGYDLQSASITIQKLVAHFALSPAARTWVPTANVLGLFLGALAGGWLADRIGRKQVLSYSMLLLGLFSLATAYATSAEMLIWMRFLTGLGLGGAMPNLIALVAETGRIETRAARVTFLTAGMPFGGMLVPLLALGLGPDFDWRTIFVAGGVAPILISAVMFAFLHESGEFLAVGRSAPDVRFAGTARILFGEGRGAATVALWTISLGTLVVLYLLLNWLPYLLSGMGFGPAEVAIIAFSFTAGGGFGALGLGWLLVKAGRRVTLLFAYLAIPIVLTVFSALTAFSTLTVVAFFLGVFVIGSQFVIYGILPLYYPVQIRGTGVGWAVAMGRVGAVLGPLFAGRMLEAGASSQEIMVATIPVVCVALVAIILLLFVLRAPNA